MNWGTWGTPGFIYMSWWLYPHRHVQTQPLQNTLQHTRFLPAPSQFTRDISLYSDLNCYQFCLFLPSNSGILQYVLFGFLPIILNIFICCYGYCFLSYYRAAVHYEYTINPFYYFLVWDLLNSVTILIWQFTCLGLLSAGITDKCYQTWLPVCCWRMLGHFFVGCESL